MATSTRTNTAARRRAAKLEKASSDDGLLEQEALDMDTDDSESEPDTAR